MTRTYADVVANRNVPDPVTFASLPQPLALLVFLALPADARGRACCVCCAWRDALADPSLWTRLDMSVMARYEPRLSSVLRGAAGRALGQLCHLDISLHHVALDVLLPVLTANASSLRELNVECLSQACGISAEALFEAAPLLQVLTAVEASYTWHNATRVLRKDPPFAPLNIRCCLSVNISVGDVRTGLPGRFGPLLAALSNVALQPALRAVSVRFVDSDLMGAVVDAVVVRRLPELTLYCCTAPDATQLVRLLVDGSLQTLELAVHHTAGVPLLDLGGAVLLANALRVNTTIKVLRLYFASLDADADVAATLFLALVGHPSLHELRIIYSLHNEQFRQGIGVTLAALIAADAPVLHVLSFFGNSLGDVGLTPIVEALPLNHHLSMLDVSGNGMSEEFARDLVVPAVRANTTLLRFVANGPDDEPLPAAAEAEELVRRRGQRG